MTLTAELEGLGGASFSPDERYRYTLWRKWNEVEIPRMVAFIGLNPSTADAKLDDPTIRRCIGYGKFWGYDGLLMLNLFAYRATDPRELLKQDDPVGPQNDDALRLSVPATAMRVGAWGAHKLAVERAQEVIPMISPYCVLGLTKDGHPKHPLYLPKHLQPEPA